MLWLSVPAYATSSAALLCLSPQVCSGDCYGFWIVQSITIKNSFVTTGATYVAPHRFPFSRFEALRTLVFLWPENKQSGFAICIFRSWDTSSFTPAADSPLLVKVWAYLIDLVEASPGSKSVWSLSVSCMAYCWKYFVLIAPGLFDAGPASARTNCQCIDCLLHSHLATGFCFVHGVQSWQSNSSLQRCSSLNGVRSRDKSLGPLGLLWLYLVWFVGWTSRSLVFSL